MVADRSEQSVGVQFPLLFAGPGDEVVRDVGRVPAAFVEETEGAEETPLTRGSSAYDCGSPDASVKPPPASPPNPEVGVPQAALSDAAAPNMLESEPDSNGLDVVTFSEKGEPPAFAKGSSIELAS